MQSLDSAKEAPPEDRWVGFLLNLGLVGRGLRRKLEDWLLPFDLGEQEFVTLWLCDRQAAARIAQGELARGVGISAAQMSAVVERLRQRGLIAMECSAHDRRRQIWRLLATGEELLAKVRGNLRAATSDLAAVLAPARQRETELLLAELAAALLDPRKEIPQTPGRIPAAETATPGQEATHARRAA